MEHFIKDLENLHKYKSSMVREFKDEFPWINEVALKHYYFSYHGSLTTEPFAECVIWIIFTNTIPISRNQVKIVENDSTKNSITVNLLFSENLC